MKVQRYFYFLSVFSLLLLAGQLIGGNSNAQSTTYAESDPSALYYRVHCSGYNNRNNHWVTGYCTNGSFSGYDTRNNNWVTGHCTAGGTFSGYDNRTNEWVTGRCDRDTTPHLDDSQYEPEYIDELQN